MIKSAGSTFFVADDLWFYIPLAGVYAACKFIFFCISKTKLIYSIAICMDGKTVYADAMIDTGNSLIDKESGAPVIIAEMSLFEEINVPYKTIGYKNIGTEVQYTKIYPVEKLSFPYEGKEYENVYITFVNKPLSHDGKYRALLHRSFMI